MTLWLSGLKWVGMYYKCGNENIYMEVNIEMYLREIGCKGVG